MGEALLVRKGGENVSAEVATQKADIELLAKLIAEIQLDANDVYVWSKYTSNGGDLLDYVYSYNSSTYPEAGTQGGYYYKIVRPTLVSIEITTQPTKTNYAAGDSFDNTGMVVTATYDTGTKKEITSYTATPSTFSTTGSQTVTISYTENGITKTDTLTVNVIAIGDFATSSWNAIHTAVQAAIDGVDLSNHWSIGDTKSVTLTTGEVIELQIADFNHDTYSDGVTAPVTFVMKNCLNAKAPMNSSNTNTGGYPASAMKTYVETNIYEKLPADLKSIVEPVKKKWYTIYSSTSSLSEASYNVWLLSEMEVFGTILYTVGNGEGTKYAIFTDDASRVKKVGSSSNWWWLGSCRSNSSGSFVYVNSSGTVSYDYAASAGGVVVGLCIR